MPGDVFADDSVAGGRSDRARELSEVWSDPDAFRAWYEGAVVKVYRYLFGRTGGDAALTEELTQQTFIQAVRSRDTFDGRADAVTWLCAIGRRKLTDHYRRLEREGRRHLRLVVREIAVSDQGPSIAHIEDRETVFAALRSLPAVQQAALVLHYVDGLTVREVAAELGRSEGAAESLLVRARERFRAAYGALSDG
jgi:RNA polymerase sigma-70 factor (ECF subfamily)